jgi:GT2 family glycosyltransferase
MGKTDPRLSVVLPTWNGLQHLKLCLPSLTSQSFADFEIIVVDNGSGDGTRDYLRRHHPLIKVIGFESNRGFSPAVNAGIRQAQGKYIVLLNNDTQVDPQWLQELVHAAETNEHVDCFASKILRLEDPLLLDSAGDAYDRRGMAWNIGRGHRDGPSFNKPKSVFSVCAAASLYRRRFFEEVGLFDEDFFAFYEDVDLGFRGQLMKRQCLYVPTAIVHHQGGGTFRHLSNAHLYYCTRNAVLVLVKNMPTILFLQNFFRIGLAYTRHFLGHFWRSGQRWGVLSGYVAACLYLPKMFPKRYRNQRRRQITNTELQALLKSQESLPIPKPNPVQKKWYQAILPTSR